MYWAGAYSTMSCLFNIKMSVVFISSFLIIIFVLVLSPRDVAALPDVFTATISGMECTLFLVMGRGQDVREEKSEVECFTSRSFKAESALVINDITSHIFKLTLKLEANAVTKESNPVRVKLIKGVLLPNPEGSSNVAYTSE